MSESTIEILARRLHAAQDMLTVCEKQFRYYEMQHRAKNTPEGTVKAAVNDKLAQQCAKARDGK